MIGSPFCHVVRHKFVVCRRFSLCLCKVNPSTTFKGESTFRIHTRDFALGNNFSSLLRGRGGDFRHRKEFEMQAIDRSLRMGGKEGRQEQEQIALVSLYTTVT